MLSAEEGAMNRYLARFGLFILFAILPADAQRLPPNPPPQKDKAEKSRLPEIIVRAQFVMVVSQREADFSQRPDVIDLKAVGDVEAALSRWGRYKLVYIKQSADLIISVRRAENVVVQLGRGAPTGRTPAEYSSEGDHLAVHDAHSGTSSPALWRKALKNGLSGRDMPLLKIFREEVEAAAAKTP